MSERKKKNTIPAPFPPPQKKSARARFFKAYPDTKSVFIAR